MIYEVYSKATDRVLGTYTTEREAHARAKVMTVLCKSTEEAA